MQKLHKAITEIDVLSPPKIYIEKILKAICENIGYPFGTVIEVDTQGEGCMMASYKLPEDYPEKVNKVKALILSSPSGEAIETGRIIVLHDALSDPRMAPWRELLQPYNIKTIVWVPLFSKAHAFGTYILYDTKIRDISEQELRSLEQIGVMLSIAITTNQYLDQLNQETKELEDEINKRKRAEEAARGDKQRAEGYLNIAGVMLATVNADENITLINKKGCEILGYKEQELIGRNWFHLLVPQRIRAEIRGVFRKLMAGHIEPVEYYENPLLTKNGEERLIGFHNTVIRDPDGQIVGALFSAEDITSRKLAEEALRESEAKYRTIVDQIPAVIYIAALDETSTTLFVSQQIEKLLGFKPSEWKKEHDIWLNQLHPDDRERVLAEVASSHASEQLFTSEYRMITRDGRIVWINDKAVIVKDHEGNHLFLQGIMFDITSRKQAEEELIKKHEQLERFTKLAVGRELKMVELKKEINALLGELGEEPRYRIAGE